MTHYIIKVLLTTALVVAISEASKRSSFVGGLLASVPMVSFIAMFWVYLETKDSGKVASLSTSIFWLVLPSLVFFVALPPLLLRLKLNFYLGFALATALMLVSYGAMVVALKRFGVNL
jgi:hypothetical protein